MKVIMISTYFPPNGKGGAEIYAYRLGKELVKNGVDITVITNTFGKRIVETFDDMKVYRVTKPPPISRISGYLIGYNFNPSSRKIKTILADENPDIIHVQHLSSTIMLYPLINYLKKPVISHVHDHWPVCYRGILYNSRKMEDCTEDCISCCFPLGLRTIGRVNLQIREKLLRKYEEKIDYFITPSNYLGDELIKRGFTNRKKIKHIPLGIDTAEFQPASFKEKIHKKSILFVGRLISYKNPTLIVRILPMILKEMDCEYIVIGEGPEADKIVELSNQYGIRKNVKVLGRVPPEEIRIPIRNASIVVVPSICRENSPMIIYEALASGTPVLVSDIGGAKELIDHSISGYSLSPYEEDKWAEKIIELFTNDELLEKMSTNARNKAEKEFDIRHNAERILEVYNELL